MMSELFSSAPARIALCLLVGCVVAASSGCGGQSSVPLYPVSGVVTLDDKPLANAGVMFLPRGNTRGNACVALTGADGKYSLKPERGGGHGAPEGEFVVTISKMKDPPAGAGSGPAAAETNLDET